MHISTIHIRSGFVSEKSVAPRPCRPPPSFLQPTASKVPSSDGTAQLTESSSSKVAMSNLGDWKRKRTSTAHKANKNSERFWKILQVSKTTKWQQTCSHSCLHIWFHIFNSGSDTGWWQIQALPDSSIPGCKASSMMSVLPWHLLHFLDVCPWVRFPGHVEKVVAIWWMQRPPTRKKPASAVPSTMAFELLPVIYPRHVPRCH